MKQLNLEGEEQQFFIDDEGLKRPIPPKGFKRWKNPDVRVDEHGARQDRCPICGCPWKTWHPGGFLIQEVQEKYDEVKKQTNNPLAERYDGVMFKKHWSRYGTGECHHCGCEFWHDYVDDPNKNNTEWFYYYDPSTADKSKEWAEDEEESA